MSGSPPTAPAPISLRRCLLLLVFLPVIVLGGMIFTYGTESPYWDEWDEVPAGLLKIYEPTLSWSDLIAQHNEHRILFPRIILLASAWLTHWDSRANLWIIFFLACVCSVGLWRLARATGGSDANLDLAKLAAANILLFTPVAFENWLWGFQIGFLLPMAALILALWLAAACRPVYAFFFAILLSFICTFSIASGFLAWLITLPLLLFSGARFQLRDRIPGLLCWLAAFAGSVVLYLHGYVRPPGDPSPLLVFSKPWTAVLYLFTYLGSPFGWPFGMLYNIVAGFVLSVIYAGVPVCLWKWRADSRLIAKILPWFMLSVYAMLNGVVIMIGRLNFMEGQASAPRYMIFAVMLPISLIYLIPPLYAHWTSIGVMPSRARIVRRILIAFLVVGLGVNILAACYTAKEWGYWKQCRLLSQALMEFSQLTNENTLTGDAHLTYGDFPQLREKARQMGALGYLRPAPLTSGAISALADPQAEPSPDYGYFENVSRLPDGRIVAYGWAVLPERERIADLVLFTAEEKGHPEQASIFCVTITGAKRRSDGSTPREEYYKLAGWATPLPTNVLSPGHYIVRAWAFDLDANRAWQLKGACELNIGPADASPK